MSLRSRLAILLLFLIASLPFASKAQQPAAAAGATVHGTVVDPDSALIPGATLTLTTSAGKSQNTTSKSDGTYTFRGVAAGTYTLTVSAPGFATFSKQSISVTSGANLAEDVQMTLHDRDADGERDHGHGATERGSGQQPERYGDYRGRAECAVGRSG